MPVDSHKEPSCEAIETRLRSALSPRALTVRDDSADHVGHAGARAGGNSHFSVYIVSEAFAGKPRVARHRLVYAALDGMFPAGLHALAITALAPGED